MGGLCSRLSPLLWWRRRWTNLRLGLSTRAAVPGDISYRLWHDDDKCLHNFLASLSSTRSHGRYRVRLFVYAQRGHRVSIFHY